jgi:phage terminase small subunit
MTPKQAIFYGEYIKDGNATRAAIAAGASEKNAHVAGARLLKNPAVAEAVAAWQARQVTKLEITAERVLSELVKLATYDPGNLYDKDGNQIPVHKLDDVTRAAVAGVDIDTIETVKIGPGSESATTIRTITRKMKLADKGANLERLGRYFKLFTDNLNHSGKLTLEELVTGASADEIAS